MDKLKSRKFWICVAAMLSSVATSIAGIRTNNEVIVTVGIICSICSAAIYAFCEAWVDGKAVEKENQNENTYVIGFRNEDDEEESDERGHGG